MNLLFHILYRFYRITSWMRYRVARRLTPAGWLVLIALLASGLMSIDTDNTVAYQAFTPLLSLLLLSVAFSWFFRVRFSATRVLPRFGTAGQPFTYNVHLRNNESRTQRDLTLFEHLADPRPGFQEWKARQLALERRARSFRFDQQRRSNSFKPARIKSVPVPEAGPNQEVETNVELTPLRRGAIRFNGVTLARPDPFGLFYAFQQVPSAQTMLILPKRYPLPQIALPGSMKYQQGGVALASNVGQSDEFVALRDYRRGDPLRHLHWRSWAKAGKPIVKEFEDEFFVRHALVLDTCTEEPNSEVFEEAVSVAASFACTIPLQETLLDLLFIGTQAYCFTAGRGLGHEDQMLEILASVTSRGDRPFSALEHLVLEHAALVSGCICVLLAWDEQRRAFIRKLQALGVPLLVMVVTDIARGETLEPGPMKNEPDRFSVLETRKIEEGLAKLGS